MEPETGASFKFDNWNCPVVSYFVCHGPSHRVLSTRRSAQGYGLQIY